LKHVSGWIIAISLSLVAALLLLEGTYRLEPFDFYSRELKAFNSKEDLAGSGNRPTAVIFGDSFTALNENYANVLRAELPNLRIINSAIPGTGIIQTSLIAARRFRQFEPSLVIYQIYVGNDLFDISYPTNWKDVSFFRNVYWSLSNHLRSIAFINYSLAQVIKGGNLEKGYQPYQPSHSIYRSSEQFSPDRYLNNEAIFLRADPALIEKQILLLNERREDFETLVKRLRFVLSLRAKGCSCILLVLPHPSQVHRRYLERTKRLGGAFHYEDLITREDYPFVQRLRAECRDCLVVNPLSLFQEKEGAGIQLYWVNDIHLNPNGNELLAEYLSTAIRKFQ
jgi:hypothetical protein